MKTIITIVTLLFLSTGIKAQNSGTNPEKFVQFYVPTLESGEKANDLTKHLKSKDGIKMCRVDALGKTVYVIYTSDYVLSDFENFLTEKGYTFTCSNEGVMGVDSFKQFNDVDCSPKK
jgi:hypothetical protein